MVENNRSHDREIEVMQSLRHQNIVQLYGVEKGYAKYFLAFEFCQGTAGDLIEKEGGFNDRRFEHLLQDISNALKYLYQQKIFHGDIKPENILYTAKKFLLSDFGLAQKYRSYDAKLTKQCGTTEYLHPDVLSVMIGNTANYGIYADIHSLAVTFMECIECKRPFRSKLHTFNIKIQQLHRLITFKVPGSIGFDGRRYYKYFRKCNFQNEGFKKQIELFIAKMMEVRIHKNSICTVIVYIYSMK